MNKSVEEIRRELFEEKAFCQRYISSITRVNDSQFGLQSFDCPTKAEFITKDDEGNYLEESLNFAWWGFNAALDAVEIGLPKTCAYESLDEHRVFVRLTYELDDNSADPVELCRRNDAVKAIETLNLGLKIK